MANRRMFHMTIIDSDAFLDLPATTQLLYFHLAMRADDDGFVNKPKAVMRICGAKDDDAKLLIDKKFILSFDSGVVVVKHWKIHNQIRKDMYKETKYKEERSMLELDENDAYRMLCTSPLQVRNESVTDSLQDRTDSSLQYRLGKDSIDKDSIGECNIDTALAMMDTACLPYSFNFVTKDTLLNWAMYKAERGECLDARAMSSLAGLVNSYVRLVGFEAVVRLIESNMASGYKNITFDRLDK